jgi:hypothetical protein
LRGAQPRAPQFCAPPHPLTHAQTPTPFFISPLPQVFLPIGYNATFTFSVDDTSTDLVVIATPTYGEVALLVSHDDPVNNTVPGCQKPCSGCIVTCTGYTWFLPSYGASPVLYIPAANPCNPLVPPGGAPVVVSPSCDPASSFRRGRYWVTLFSFSKLAETSIAVVQTGAPLTLADGQPQDHQTGPVTLCPSRDNTTGLCVGNPIGWAPNVQTAVFTAVIPAGPLILDEYVILDRLCGNVTGYCGPPLHAYVISCPVSGPGACTANSAFPWGNNNQADVVVTDVQAAIAVPPCTGAVNCILYVGVYPMCDGNAGNVRPGQNCPPAYVRATLSTNTGIERVSNDCFGSGRTCVLPEVQALPGQVKRYEAYASDGATTVRVKAEACSGALSLFYCDAFSGNCNPVNQPGPANNDASATVNPWPAAPGSATITATITTGLFFLGVRPVTQAGMGYGSYQLTLQAGQGPLVVNSPSQPNVLVTQTAPGVFFVQWDGIYISSPGTLTYRAPNPQYNVYAFPDAGTGAAQLNTPCGCDDAAANSAGVVYAQNIAGNDVTLSVNPALAYVVQVVGTCPAGACMPANQMAQRAAAVWVRITPGPPTPSPTPAPPPPPPAPAASSGMSTAGAAIIAVSVLLGVGAGGFFAYRRWTGATGSVFAGLSLPSFASWSAPSYRYGYVPSAAADGAMFSAPSLQDSGLQNEEQDASYTAL